MRKWFRDESGSLIVEASFIYPMVILVLLFLLVWGMLQVQRAVIFKEVNTVADIGANTVSNEGYSVLTNTSADKAAVKAYYRKNNPYRYWNFNYTKSEGTLKQHRIICGL